MPNMDLLKQLSEAKAHGLSKEEFFRLLDAEIKLSEHRQQTSTGSNTGSAASSADVSKPLAKFLQDVDERLKTHEQQQSARFNEYMREQQQQLQQFQQQHQQHFQLFQQQQQQQLQHLQQQHLHHLQQQQERQHVEHIQQLQQQQQQMLTQVQQFQKQLRIAQAQPSQHGGVATGYSKEHQKEKQSFETALSQVKENFHEMRNTVLNRLEEEKIYMRDELSKAQHELKADLSKVAANVTEIRQLYEELARNTQEKDSGKLERKKIMDRINASQGNVQQTIRNMVQELKDFTLKQVEEQQTIAKDRLKDEVEILQRDVQEARTDIIAVTDKECQLIKNYITCRGAIQNPKKRYVCDLCVKNFKTLINTETKVGGLPWYIEQFRSSVKGGVGFTKNGKMSVWLDYFRKPREVGLEPQSNIMGHVIASIVHLTDFKNPLIAGAETWVFYEDDIDLDDKDGVGIEVGSINCAEVLEEGLIDDNGSVFVRFEILLD